MNEEGEQKVGKAEYELKLPLASVLDFLSQRQRKNTDPSGNVFQQLNAMLGGRIFEASLVLPQGVLPIERILELAEFCIDEIEFFWGARERIYGGCWGRIDLHDLRLKGIMVNGCISELDHRGIDGVRMIAEVVFEKLGNTVYYANRAFPKMGPALLERRLKYLEQEIELSGERLTEARRTGDETVNLDEWSKMIQENVEEAAALREKLHAIEASGPVCPRCSEPWPGPGSCGSCAPPPERPS